jgi:hypothetical protein
MGIAIMREWFVYGICILLMVPALAWAEVKTFEVSVEEAVSRNQSQEAVESFALQKAKRLAVEKAGTYISTMTVLEKGRLSRAEVTALASGIVRTDVASSKAVVKNDQVFMQVTAKVAVDTSVLEKQLEALLKDRALLKELEAKDKQMRTLEDKLARVHGAEVERLRKLNAQAVALEMEREKQRLFLEEQRIKAQGDITKAELTRLAEERDRAVRFEQLRKEQETSRKRELAAIAEEQNRIKKAQLENQANAAELVRNTEMNMAKWVAIDNRLSAEQAKTEAQRIQAEFIHLLTKIDNQYKLAEENLKTAYQNKISATKTLEPTAPAAKDPFETREEYEERIAKHINKVFAARADNTKKIKQLKSEEMTKLAELKVQLSELKLAVLKPYAERLGQLQKRIFVLAKKSVIIDLQAPEPEKSRFPLMLRYNGEKYRTYWEYYNRDKARLFYQTRSYLIAKPIFRLEPYSKYFIRFCFVGARIIHPGTNESRELIVASPKTFDEIELLTTIE